MKIKKYTPRETILNYISIKLYFKDKKIKGFKSRKKLFKVYNILLIFLVRVRKNNRQGFLFLSKKNFKEFQEFQSFYFKKFLIFNKYSCTHKVISDL